MPVDRQEDNLENKSESTEGQEGQELTPDQVLQQEAVELGLDTEGQEAEEVIDQAEASVIKEVQELKSDAIGADGNSELEEIISQADHAKSSFMNKAEEIKNEGSEGKVKNEEIIKQDKEALINAMGVYRTLVDSKEYQAMLPRGAIVDDNLIAQRDLLYDTALKSAKKLVASSGAQDWGDLLHKTGINVSVVLARDRYKLFDKGVDSRKNVNRKDDSQNSVSRNPEIGTSGIFRTPRGDVKGTVVGGRVGGPFEIDTPQGRVKVDRID